MIALGDMVRDKGADVPLGVVVDLIGEPCVQTVAVDAGLSHYVMRRVNDVEVEARCG